jgi:hypothetical protein
MSETEKIQRRSNIRKEVLCNDPLNTLARIAALNSLKPAIFSLNGPA